MPGVDGYAGEQDGSTVILLAPTYEPFTKKVARSLLIPKHARLHWARYTPGSGGTCCVGIWSNRCSPSELQQAVDSGMTHVAGGPPTGESPR